MLRGYDAAAAAARRLELGLSEAGRWAWEAAAREALRPRLE
jgi:hypothetical protein